MYHVGIEQAMPHVGIEPCASGVIPVRCASVPLRRCAVACVNGGIGVALCVTIFIACTITLANAISFLLFLSVRLTFSIVSIVSALSSAMCWTGVKEGLLQCCGEKSAVPEIWCDLFSGI